MLPVQLIKMVLELLVNVLLFQHAVLTIWFIISVHTTQLHDKSLNRERLKSVSTLTLKFNLKILENVYKCIPPTPQNNGYI